MVIRSAEEVDVNKWTSISIARRHGEGQLKVGDSEPVSGKAIGPARTMYLKTHMYLGGYDKRILLNKGVDVSRGFDGCISGVCTNCFFCRLNFDESFAFNPDIKSIIL